MQELEVLPHTGDAALTQSWLTKPQEGLAREELELSCNAMGATGSNNEAGILSSVGASRENATALECLLRGGTSAVNDSTAIYTGWQIAVKVPLARTQSCLAEGIRNNRVVSFEKNTGFERDCQATDHIACAVFNIGWFTVAEGL